MAQILDIDDPLWKTPALRDHECGGPLPGFHKATGFVRWTCPTGTASEMTALDEILDWIADEARPGKVYLEHEGMPNRPKGSWPQGFGPKVFHSHFYFTDENLALEFRMTWI